MKHFKRVARIDVAPIRTEIESQIAAFSLLQGRQVRARAQRETTSVPLRGLRKSKLLGRRRRDVLESRFTAMAAKYPVSVAFLEQFADSNGGSLGRAKIARLAPGAKVYRHVDRGNYYLRHDRYHIVVSSPTGSVLCAGDEEVRMQEGEVWWFDNKSPHEAINDSHAQRIHLIFDLKPDDASERRGTCPVDASVGATAPPVECLLVRARQRTERHQAEVVQEAVRLYLVGRERPRQWVELLSAHGIAPDDPSFRPIRSTLALIGPAASAAVRRQQARATVWAIERIDAGDLQSQNVADALLDEGGVAAVAMAWKLAQAANEAD